MLVCGFEVWEGSPRTANVKEKGERKSRAEEAVWPQLCLHCITVTHTDTTGYICVVTYVRTGNTASMPQESCIEEGRCEVS